MSIGWLFGKNKAPREEPDYLHTEPHDGTKYVDPDEFMEDKEVQDQVRRLAQIARQRAAQNGSR